MLPEPDKQCTIATMIKRYINLSSKVIYLPHFQYKLYYFNKQQAGTQNHLTSLIIWPQTIPSKFRYKNSKNQSNTLKMTTLTQIKPQVLKLNTLKYWSTTSDNTNKLNYARPMHTIISTHKWIYRFKEFLKTTQDKTYKQWSV